MGYAVSRLGKMRSELKEHLRQKKGHGKYSQGYNSSEKALHGSYDSYYRMNKDYFNGPCKSVDIAEYAKEKRENIKKDGPRIDTSLFPRKRYFTFIYGLCDPETKQVLYVGESNNPQLRFEGHLSDSKGMKKTWIDKLAAQGKKPLLTILERCAITQWKERECFWIAKISQERKLLNLTAGGEQSFQDGPIQINAA